MQTPRFISGRGPRLWLFILIFLHGISLSGNGQTLADSTIVRGLVKRIKEKNYWSTAPDSIGYFARSGLELATRINDLRGIADMNKQMGIYYYAKTDYTNALKFYEHAKSNYTELHSEEGVTKMLLNLGLVYNKLGIFDVAANYYFEAISRMESHTQLDTLVIASAYMAVGTLYRNSNEFGQSIGSFRKAVKLLTGRSDFEGQSDLAGGLTNIGTVFIHLGRYDSAKLYHTKALQLFESINNPKGQITTYNNLADVAKASNNFDLSLSYARKAYELCREKNFSENEIISLTTIAQAYDQLGRTNEALSTWLQAKELAVKHRSRLNLLSIYQGLSDTYNKLHEPSEAFKYLQRFASLKDTIYTENASRTLASLGVKYEVDQKEAAIKFLQQDQKYNLLTRNVMIGLIAALLIISGLIVMNMRQRIRRDRKLMQEKERRLRIDFERQLTQSQIKALQAQMNPHFIFNCLNSIDYFIQLSKPVQASDYLAKFAKLIRLFMEELTVDYTSLDKELQTLDLYLQLEKLRFGKKFKYEIRTIDVFPEGVMIPSMVIQPFIENAILHGIQPLNNDSGKVIVEIKQEGDHISCCIEDNGVGRKSLVAEQNRGRKSFGISLSRQRLQLLQPKARIDVIDLKEEDGTPAGTRVNILFVIADLEEEVGVELQR